MAIRYSFFLLILTTTSSWHKSKLDDVKSDYINLMISPKKGIVRLYWKDPNGKLLNTFESLKKHLNQQHKQLAFAMNGGMFTTNYDPLGLYIEQGKIINPINNKKGKGNFYLKPNGIFVIYKNTAQVISTSDFVYSDSIQYATQSGPMLMVNGQFHKAFKEYSTNTNIRNGVGIMPNGDMIFSISTKKVTFYEFAQNFKQLGCKNALYLDGFVSALEHNNKVYGNTKGKFGVIIGCSN